jgi:hypothetical protein
MKYFAIYAFKTLINKQINQRWINLINEVSANHRSLMKSLASLAITSSGFLGAMKFL